MRTTIVADEAMMIELKRVARQKGRSVSDVMREAVGEYLAREEAPQNLSFIGSIKTGGRRDTARRAEEILAEGMAKAVRQDR